MREDAELRAAETSAIDDAGVDELIDDDDVVLVEQGRDGAEGGGVAAGETQRSFGGFECGERFFEFAMRRERAADESGRAGARTEIARGVRGGFRKRGFVGEAEVIVRREVEHRPAIDGDAHALRRTNVAELAVESRAAQLVQLLKQLFLEGVHQSEDMISRNRLTGQGQNANGRLAPAVPSNCFATSPAFSRSVKVEPMSKMTFCGEASARRK